MKVSDLVKLLRKYQDASVVKVTWEGQVIPIDPENIYLSADGVLLIDADDNCYKYDFESGNMRAA